jgi:glycine oxidase
MSKHPDVVVVGGGIVGLSCAYFLARDGLSVEVLDRGDLGKEASWAGAGIIPPGNPDRAATPIDQLRGIGSARFPAFSAELRELTGIDNGYRKCGGIELLQAHDADVLTLWEDEGLPFERLSGSDLQREGLAAGRLTGEPYYLPTCAQVRNPWHLRALVAACERVGVRLRPHTPVTGWVTERQRAIGVQTDSNEAVSAGRVLLAAGAWSDGLLGPLGVRPGVHPVRGQIVLFHNPRPRSERVLMLGKRYFVPRDDGRVLVGSTEEPEAGFERYATSAGVTELLAFATRVFPEWASAEVERCWAGLRPGSPDGLPFIGPVPGREGVFVAAGHFRAGVQLSIGTGQAVADVFQGRPPCVPLDAFRLDRPPQAGVKPAFRS